MIRWSYVVPRLVVLVVVLLAAHFTVPIVLRWTMVQTVEMTTGMDVDVDRTWVSFTRGSMHLNNVQLASSRSKDRNVFEFESATLSMDLGALSQRHWVIDDAQIRGIQLNTPRTSGAARGLQFEVPLPDFKQLTEQGREISRQWFGHLANNLQRRVEDEFESVRLARDLTERWPGNYERLEQQVRTCRESAERLHRTLSGPITMPKDQREFAVMKKRWDEVKQLHGEISRLRGHVDQLARKVDQDRAAVQTAFFNDRDKLHEAMQLVQLDGQKLNSFLLDSEYYRLWSQIQPWLTAVRWLTESPDFDEQANRGEIVQYESNLPGFLIRNAQLDGQAVINGRKLHFGGRAENLTGDPKKLDRPTRIHLVTEGPFKATIQAELDCSPKVPRQGIAFRCVGVPLDARTYGLSDTLSIEIGPSKADVAVKVVVRGEQLQGQIALVQRDLELRPIVGAEFGGQEMQRILTDLLGGIDCFDLVIDLSGTVKAPCWTIHSDLGPLLQERVQGAFQLVVDQHAQRLAVEAEGHLGQQIHELQTVLAAKQTDLTKQLGVGDELLSALSEPAVSRLKPLDRLFRRF